MFPGRCISFGLKQSFRRGSLSSTMENRAPGIREDDDRIIERVLAGDTRAFALLVDRHREKAMTLALRMLKNREDAEEALQDAFVRAFRSLDRFERKSRFSTWLYRIVFNVCFSVQRKQGTAGIFFEEDAPAMAVHYRRADRPDVACEGAEFERIVQESIDSLPPVYGTIFTLYFVNDMSYEEIAEVAGLPINTVKTRLFRARGLLRAAVAMRFNDSGDASQGVNDAMVEK